MAVQSARGMRDFLPADMVRRDRVRETIRRVFERFGYEPFETPAVERLETLLGKYGEEGDQLLFKILKRGEGSERGEADMGLRYDLTVPLARVVAMNQGKMVFPFKRYHIAPVWRADRPQRGRFREFVQCDVDVVGTEALSADAELLAVAQAALAELGFAGDYRIRVNHRRVMRGMIEAMGVEAAREGDVLVALDKLDKIGADGVSRELSERGFGHAVSDRVGALVRAREQAPRDGLAVIEEFVGASETGQKGLAELRELCAQLEAYALPEGSWLVDPVLARGLSYYTGPVFEAELDGFSGSVAGGGRYDELIGMFLGQRIPSTGLSLGFERLLVIMEERGMFAGATPPVDVLMTVFGPEDRAASIGIAQRLREGGVRVDLFPEDRKIGKQLKYASARGIPLAAIYGPDDRERGTLIVKDLRTGSQHELALGSMAEAIRRLLQLGL